MSDSKVIHFNRLRLAAVPKRNEQICRHRHVLVCEKTRMLECEACGQVIDPFDFMWEWANRDRNLEHTRKGLKKDIEMLSENLKDLKREERNIRARLRRLKEFER